ncbi:MAG: T9SS type A sorting domain-containing protein [Bacteroidetes bacterium]|nr:T9SS type A sorting domain-containing protein [Bacteroidota bacterium]
MKKFFLLFVLPLLLFAQDQVDVTFRYNAPASPTVFLVGEMNGWNNAATPMEYQGNSLWTKTYRLQVGTNPNADPVKGVPSAYQYKFYYAGAAQWPNDPLNHHENPKDNNNTFIYTRDVTIYHLLPNQRQSIIKTSTPVISAFVFPKIGATVDTSSIKVTIDGIEYTHLGNFYDESKKQLQFPAPVPLSNGKHFVSLSVKASSGAENSDSVNFTVQAGFVQITTQGGYSTRNAMRLLRGVVQNSSVTQVKIVRNNFDTTYSAVSNGAFSVIDTLTEGINTFKAVVDTGTVIVSDPVSFTYLVDHSPFANASMSFASGSQLTLSASASTHPDNSAMTFSWLDDDVTPLGLNGKTGATVTIDKPTAAGEYYYGLIATDSLGNSDTARFYFTITNDGQYENPSYASNPIWVKKARVYFMFPKSFTAQGTLNAAALRLQYIKDMGFSVVWVMPVMTNAYPIDQNYGPGYNIADFYNVAPEYGTNQDFKNFVSQAHSLGLKVILDVTPNHTSRFHPWSQDAHLYKQDSRYWNWYEHTTIAHNTNGLGQSFDPDGFNYYSGFSDQLLNFNWSDIDARTEMINVYKYWIKNFKLDGFRFDVYWGPHRRYGNANFDQPLRTALKHSKPDIFLLAEDDGTGSGTETIYADYSSGNIRGGVDAGYDFKLYFNQISGFAFNDVAVTNLHNEINNGGYYPGPNSLYMRFMESQDEDRITQFYSQNNYYDTLTTLKRTMPMASTIFSVPGFPMIWNGQEIGYGYGISGSKEKRNRSTINWNFPGKFLQKHYQKLAWIRGSFSAFNTQSFERIGTGNGYVYGILRKYKNENAVTLTNFADVPFNASLSLSISGGAPNLLFDNPQDGKSYYVNDVYNDTTHQITFSGGTANFAMNIPAYGTAVLIISDSVKRVTVPVLTSVKQEFASVLPSEFSLSQNYPNPFNPETNINFQLSSGAFTTLKVYDLVGREVSTLVNEQLNAGRYSVRWNAANFASGIYFYKLTAGSFTQVKKMMVMK